MNYPVSTSIHLRFDKTYSVPVNDQIERIIQGGFQFLDFDFLDWNADLRSPFITDEWERWVASAGEVAAKHGAQFNQAHAAVYNGLRYPGMTDADVTEQIVRSIKGCAMLGIPWMVFHAIYTADPNWMEINHGIFDPLLEVARKYNVGMAFENTWPIHEDVPLAKTEALIELVDSFHDPLVGICWDTGHGNIHGGKEHLKQYTDQYKEITKLGKRLKALHIDDNNGYVDDHIAPFEGVINWNDVMRALRDIGYEHSFTFEAHNATRRVPETLADQKIAYLKRLGDTLVAWDDGFR